MDPLILTLRLDPASTRLLDSLRREHFPPERNFLDAHVTLFHALPGDEEDAVRDTLEATRATTSPFPVRLSRLRSLGRGVAVEIDSPVLIRLRAHLASRWASWLGAQDKQGFRPHVTIQNKVTPDRAKALLANLAPGWESRDAEARGLDLWRYAGGPWDALSEHPFII